ncbi:hypothetical protein [Blastococcus brunescens]|uniref:Uncharacterized protein n=1 Tax=Blastococcus brunescens TaxID=1564165 RepID=A0ABZ1AWM6_9ACTN|nr:hypothetical protein [Blastococcus sp. BMG 8361]WRL62864.1 hypothetical protein U6N30_23735 [Blastococcus sp. BMG 8361]
MALVQGPGPSVRGLGARGSFNWQTATRCCPARTWRTLTEEPEVITRAAAVAGS